MKTRTEGSSGRAAAVRAVLAGARAGLRLRDELRRPRWKSGCGRDPFRPREMGKVSFHGLVRRRPAQPHRGRAGVVQPEPSRPIVGRI